MNAQIKPHFLYNTLNTLTDLCVTDPDKAKGLIDSLTEYLKLILDLDNMEEQVSLERELELARAYTAIEKERFPSIRFYTDYPLKMPKISLPACSKASRFEIFESISGMPTFSLSAETKRSGYILTGTRRRFTDVKPSA